jgi:protein TonB
MRTPAHSWQTQYRQSFRRFALGGSAALSLTLVAFEWRSDIAMYRIPDGLDEEPWLEDELPPVVIIQAEERAAAKPRQLGRVVATSEPVATDPIVEPMIEPVLDGTSTSPASDTAPGSSRALLASDSVDAGPTIWNFVERQPYFMDCLEGGLEQLTGCTEARIDAHLQRHFRVPEQLRREEFTVVNLEVRKDGQIGRIHCAPAPSKAVQQELERVLRTLPAFVPGSQNGHPVAVIYQLPFRVARR